MSIQEKIYVPIQKGEVFIMANNKLALNRAVDKYFASIKANADVKLDEAFDELKVSADKQVAVTCAAINGTLAQLEAREYALSKMSFLRMMAFNHRHTLYHTFNVEALADYRDEFVEWITNFYGRNYKVYDYGHEVVVHRCILHIGNFKVYF